MVTLKILFFFVVLWGLLTYSTCKNKHTKCLLFLMGAFLSMWYVHSMVDPNSLPDLPTYKEVFSSLDRIQWKNITNHWAHQGYGYSMELGFLYVNKIIGLLISNFTVFLWLYSFFMLLAYFKTIGDYSPNAFLSVLILLLIPYGQSLFVIRQHMAMALLFSTIPFIIERKLLPFLLIIGVTFFTFHHSCLIFLPLYFIYGFNGKRLIFVLGVFMLLVSFFWSTISLIGIYLDYESFVMEAGDELSNVTTFIQFSLFFLLYVFLLGKDVFRSGINKLCFCTLALSFFLNGMSMGLNLGRITMYYNVFAILSVPISLEYLRIKHFRYIAAGVIIILLMIQMIYGSNNQYFEKMRLLSFF